jgi:hypothetical protein
MRCRRGFFCEVERSKEVRKESGLKKKNRIEKLKGRQQAPARAPKLPSPVKPPQGKGCFNLFIIPKHSLVNPI